jgi:hypothetical protein
LQLWCLEEYWQYSLFNLAMILGFEATVTTTRRLNIQKLRGMGNKATTYVAPTWHTMTNGRARYPGLANLMLLLTPYVQGVRIAGRLFFEDTTARMSTVPAIGVVMVDLRPPML